METESVLRRIHELELEVQKLKTQLAQGGKKRVQVVVKKSVGFVLTYWTLLSFLVAVGVAVYIKKAFNVDYFENYRTLAASREVAEFHNKLGNELLQRQEWAAADEAFGRALTANASHPDAAYGQLKSRVFKPVTGEKYTSPRTQDTMIAFLRERRPGDPDLDMLQALRYWTQSQKEKARGAAMAALQKKPDFAWALMLLGHIEMSEGNVPAAITWNEKAVATDPGNTNARSNLGFMYLITGDLDRAAKESEQAYAEDASILSPLVLSDIWRLKGDYSRSLSYSRVALSMVQDEDVRKSRLGETEWFYNYLPLKKDDRESPKEGIYARSFPTKEALCHFALAIDLALNGQEEDAEKSWSKLDVLYPDNGLRDYYINKLKATAAWAPEPLSESAQSWLKSKIAEQSER